MMNWILTALAVIQVAAATSDGFTAHDEYPWVPIDVAWSGVASSSIPSDHLARALLGRRDLLQCSPLWGQCGGKNWKGSKCCASGSSCQNGGNEYYSQCKPSAETAVIVEEEDPVVKQESPPVKNLMKQGSATPDLGGTTFKGDATYYSDNTIGACSQEKKPEGFRAVALNSKQWDNGALCGTCIEGFYREGYPVGSGAPLNFKAIIDNLCPECSHGDLDFRIDGIGTSDGRWPLEWKIIPCPTTGLSVTRENGNRWYSKLKVEGGPGPVTSMTCKGLQGEKTSDAFFEFQHGGSFCGSGGVDCTVSFSTGGSDSLSISKQQLGSFC